MSTEIGIVKTIYSNPLGPNIKNHMSAEYLRRHLNTQTTTRASH